MKILGLQMPVTTKDHIVFQQFAEHSVTPSGVTPSGIVYSHGVIDDEDAKRLKAAWSDPVRRAKLLVEKQNLAP